MIREREEAEDVRNRCFGDVPQTKQTERSSQKEDRGRDTGLCRRSVNIAFLQSSEHLGREAGVYSGRSAVHTRSSVSPPNGSVYKRRVMTKWTPIPLGFGAFLTAFTLHSSLATTSSPGHGSRVQTT